MRKQSATARASERARINAILEANRVIVARGHCPTCGRPLRRNQALAGWWQCSQFGAPAFRIDPFLPEGK